MPQCGLELSSGVSSKCDVILMKGRSLLTYRAIDNDKPPSKGSWKTGQVQLNLIFSAEYHRARLRQEGGDGESKRPVSEGIVI